MQNTKSTTQESSMYFDILFDTIPSKITWWYVRAPFWERGNYFTKKETRHFYLKILVHTRLCIQNKRRELHVFLYPVYFLHTLFYNNIYTNLILLPHTPSLYFPGYTLVLHTFPICDDTLQEMRV